MTAIAVGVLLALAADAAWDSRTDRLEMLRAENLARTDSAPDPGAIAPTLDFPIHVTRPGRNAAPDSDPVGGRKWTADSRSSLEGRSLRGVVRRRWEPLVGGASRGWNCSIGLLGHARSVTGPGGLGGCPVDSPARRFVAAHGRSSVGRASAYG